MAPWASPTSINVHILFFTSCAVSEMMTVAGELRAKRTSPPLDGGPRFPRTTGSPTSKMERARHGLAGATAYCACADGAGDQASAGRIGQHGWSRGGCWAADLCQRHPHWPEG